MGFAFTTDLSGDGCRAASAAAVANGRSTEPDPFQSIPDARERSYEPVAIHDPAVLALTEQAMIDHALSMEREAFRVDPRIKRTRKSSVTFSESHTLILSTKGADVSYKSTACSASIEVVAEEGGESQGGYDFDVTRYYSRLRVDEVGRRAAKQALALLGAKSIPSVKAPVVLDFRVAEEFLSLLAPAVSAENVQKKKSLFMGRLGSFVVSDKLNVIDDGLLDGGLGTAPSDDEAVPARRKAVIENGRLALFLHNTYTANRERTASTGNGVRSFKGTPGVGVTNFFIQPGAASLDDLIREAGTGLYVTEVMGAHTANPISGDFSVGAVGFWIEKGKRAYPVREIAIAGNILELMKNVVAVGSDLRFSGRIGSPSLLVKELSIGGK
jgi:PmbA protein